jgi:hypothetical protein
VRQRRRVLHRCAYVDRRPTSFSREVLEICRVLAAR